MYASSSFVGHSLWLVPREPARSTLQNIIDGVSSEQSTVCFQAHATLIAGVQPEGREKEVLAKAESLALEFKSISARVECTAVKDLYFQSVFALLTRDQALLDAHKTARVEFGQDPDNGSDYMPHISLVYGDLPMSTREAIRHDAESGLKGLWVDFDCIEVWLTEGVVSEWKLVGSFPLQQP